VKVAYVFGGFPYFSQTFNMEEIRGIMEKGLDVMVFSMIRPRGYQSAISHSSFRDLERVIVYSPGLFSLRLAISQLHYLLRKPLTYLWLYLYVMLGHRARILTMIKSLAFMPVAFHYAHRMELVGIEHVHAGMSRYAATHAMVISRITGLPFSFTVHGPKSFLRGAMQAEKVHHARFVTTVSEFNRKLIEKYAEKGHLDKVHVIRCGLDLRKFTFIPPTDGGAGFSVLSVARMDRDKGLEYLIRAVASLEGRVRGLSLVLVGEGPEKGNLEKLARDLNVEELVRFTGPLEHHLVLEAYREAHVFVLPSFWEGIPVVLMEAMASGVPVIATRITGIPELVADGESGILVPTADSTAIAIALLRFYEDSSLRTRVAQKARKRIEEEYTITGRSEALLRLFTGVEEKQEQVTRAR
jgi:colanic acid/amylovoran biosynthesis glycosyltransferase